VVIADGERDYVGSRMLQAASSAHHMLCEGHLGVKVEVESASSAAPTGARPPRLPRGAVSGELLLRSSAVDIVSLVLVLCR
jgi:hypothetical protein